MKATTQEKYIERIKNDISRVETTRKQAYENTPEKHFYIGSLGGQLTALKKELEYLKTHRLIQ